MSFSIILTCSNDTFFRDRFPLIVQACNDLQKNLEDKKIISEIVFIDYINEHNKEIPMKDLFPVERKFVNINYHPIKFDKDRDKNKDYKKIISPMLNKIAVNLAKFDFILFKNIDTFFNSDLYDFLKNTKLNSNYFYNSYRYDYFFSNKINNYLDFFKNNKNLFTINPLSQDYKYNYFMKLHANAVGDFTLAPKKEIIRANYITDKLYNDLLLIYKFNSFGLNQYLINKGAIIKYISNTAWNMNIKTLELTKFQVRFENYLYKIFSAKKINLIRGIFNYPKQIFRGNKISSYERLVILRIFLNKIFKIPLY